MEAVGRCALMVIADLNVPAGMDSPRMTTQDAMVKTFKSLFCGIFKTLLIVIWPSV